MKIIKIDNRNRTAFEALDPLSYLDDALPFPCFMMGAVEEDDPERPVGLLIGGTFRDTLVILWLYVDYESRRKGAGNALLSAALSKAEKNGLSSVTAVMGDEGCRMMICPFEKEYFSYRSFNEEIIAGEGNRSFLIKPVTGESEKDAVKREELIKALAEALDTAEENGLMPVERALTEEDIMVSAEEIVNSRLLKHYEEEKELMQDTVFSIEELSPRRFRSALETCLKEHPYRFEGDPMEYPAAWFDPALSCCYMEEGKVVGLMLLHRDGEKVYWVDYFASISGDSKDQIVLMAKYIGNILVNTYPPETRVVIRRKGSKEKRLTVWLFGK